MRAIASFSLGSSSAYVGGILRCSVDAMFALVFILSARISIAACLELSFGIAHDLTLLQFATNLLDCLSVL